MVLSRNKKNDVYPCKPQFNYIKVVFKGSKLYRNVFLMITYAFIKKYWGSNLNLNTQKVLDNVLIGVCVVISSNRVNRFKCLVNLS